MNSIAVIAPHPDDETLGCGGSILRWKSEGHPVHWIIVTAMHADGGFGADEMRQREQLIEAVSADYGFDSVVKLGFPTCSLDAVPLAELVPAFKDALDRIQPTDVLLPFPGDAHSDHRVTFEAALPSTKWFRHGSTDRVLCYEALSETDAVQWPGGRPFTPQLYIDIADQLERKLAILDRYSAETESFPFPRSAEAVRALAALRGSQCGFTAAESFMLLRGRE